MHLPLTLRHALVNAVVGLSLAASAGLTTAQPRTGSRGDAATAPVMGLIVQLRDAPSHVELARERAQTPDAAVEPRERARWQRLVTDLRGDADVLRELPGWANAGPQRDPVGASAQVLRFVRPLTREQAERVAARLAARPEVAWVEPNTRERRQQVATNAPDDPYFRGLSGQWWLQEVQGSNATLIEGRLRGVPGFLPAWLTRTTGSATAVVAVLDSGITCHPDLGNLTSNCIGGAILPGYDFVSDHPVARLLYANDGDGRDSDPRDPGDWVSRDDQTSNPQAFSDCEVEDSSWHGTVIAGMVAARTNNATGVAATNWQGRVVPVRVSGKCGADVSDIVDGMRWAAGLRTCKRSDGNGGCAEFAPDNDNPARIINISFGGSAACTPDKSPAYLAAIKDVRAARFADGTVGAVVVAAAGNHWGAVSRPASCAGAIGVGALNRDGFKTNYSNFGASLAISTVGGDDNFGDGAVSGAWAPRLADNGLLTIGNCGLRWPETDCTRQSANTLPDVSWYYNHFGTSFSAPIVAGTVSLMLSVRPTLTVEQIEQGLRISARPHVTFAPDVPNLGLCSDANPGRCQCTRSTCGDGILDVQEALHYASLLDVYVNTRAFGELVDTPELRAAADVGPDRPANPGAAPPPASGGGGAFGPVWLLALGLATLLLRSPLSAGPRRRALRMARNPRQEPRR